MYQYADRITALAAIQSPIGGQDIFSSDVRAFLNMRARHWQISHFMNPDPRQCNAVPKLKDVSKDEYNDKHKSETTGEHKDEPQNDSRNEPKNEPEDESKTSHISVSDHWLEKPRGGLGQRADTPFAGIEEVKERIEAHPENISSDGFQDITPFCPTFGGGDAWAGECVFTQPIVQQAVLSFFEEVARGKAI